MILYSKLADQIVDFAYENRDFTNEFKTCINTKEIKGSIKVIQFGYLKWSLQKRQLPQKQHLVKITQYRALKDRALIQIPFFGEPN